ncbi:MAG: S9 family peptidase [Bacteroidales bacterium]|nr:S9 family peptidase [Bacteroidales bacterium]MBR5862914.1 S9 family peptidase [Bacteroidales bacterium]
MKTFRTIASILLLVALAVGVITLMKKSQTTQEEGFIGKSGIMIENGHMTPEVLLAFGRLSDPQVSPDGKHILYGVSYTSVEGNRSVRNLYICNLDGTDNQLLTQSGKSIANARWSKDGKHIAYIKGGQIWTAAISVKKGRWTLSGARQISNVPAGVGEFKLSPDQTKVMYISYVKSHVDKPVDKYADLDKATAYTTDDLMYRHWDHTVLEIPHTFTADFNFSDCTITPENSTDLLAGETELYELPTEPFGGLEQLCWSPDGKFIAYSCRKLVGKRYAFSTNTEIYIYNVETCKCSVIDMKGGYDTDPVWSPDGSKIAWISMERDGYEADKQRLMVAAIEMTGDGKTIIGTPVDATADFKYNVSGPVWTEDSKGIYFASLAEGLQGIFEAVEGAEGWRIRRLTAEDSWYDFGSPFHVVYGEEGEVTLYTTWCSMDFPTELVSVKYSDNGIEYTPVTKENEHILSQLAEHKTEARMIKTVDGKDMLTWVLYPPQFDATKVYPGITICLGGPQGTLSQGWSYRWNYRLMAAQGYVVVLPNRRGTTAFGQEWTEQISGDYPGLNMQDYLVAARTVKDEPFVGKMAACGASYGGYSVYYLCGTHGDVFDAFIAHAGIFNEEHMYMTTEEMWFPNFDNGGLHEAAFDPRVGTDECPAGPAGDGLTFGGIKQGGSPWSTAPKAVRHYKLSPHNLVCNWHTPLMVIHGGMDYRVPVDQGMAAYNCAQMMGVPSRLLIFPDENHWILKPQNAMMWHREYFRWLDQWCK